MKTPGEFKNQNYYCVSILIAFCFFWGGSGFLVWSAQLSKFFNSDTVLLITECFGYLVQFIGVILYALTIRYNPKFAFSRVVLPVFGIIFFLLLLLSTFFNSLLITLFSGFLTNLICGYVQGLYLTYLTCLVPQTHRGTSFAFAYALGAIGTYLASSLFSGGLNSYGMISVIGIVISWTIILNYLGFKNEQSLFPEKISGKVRELSYFRKSFLPMCLLVFVFNLLYKTSFYASELIYISGALRVEFVRAFSAIGLIIAGIVNDLDRKYGLICCLLSLLFPFLCLTLINIPNAATILCILCFILLSFIMVYRAISISDLAGKDLRLLPFAGMGLGIGRLGESLGTLVGYQLRSHQVALIAVLSVLFILAVFIAFHVYQKFYSPTVSEDEKEDKALVAFENKYDLSLREKEVFRLIVSGKSNAELADSLFVSESTIKFHIGHILKKTSCLNRSQLIKKYRTDSQ